MDPRVLELLNQLIVLIIYGIVISREITRQSLDSLNLLITVGGIIFSVLLMFFTWYLKTEKLVR
ncbi:MAG: hypothetical protein KJ600_02675 [Nanoarchaeota archaeon]|nr:hypothetical protein [Nanoarchaeota archaeon]MBU1103435.1 hypothetical protein [Nanoarchaeota archaeon]